MAEIIATLIVGSFFIAMASMLLYLIVDIFTIDKKFADKCLMVSLILALTIAMLSIILFPIMMIYELWK